MADKFLTELAAMRRKLRKSPHRIKLNVPKVTIAKGSGFRPEYAVKTNRGGKVREAETYYTNDANDAHRTAEDIGQRLGVGKTVIHKLKARRVPLDSGGYSKATGQYFGSDRQSQPVYEVENAFGNVVYVRAADKEHAKQKAAKDFPGFTAGK